MVLNVKMANRGFSLIEILVAIAIFSVIVGTAMGVFASAIKSQKRVLAQQELLDQTSYAMEYISRALRMARKDISGSCLTTVGAGNNYETDGNRIRFLNYLNKCQEFFFENNQIKERKSTDSTAANFEASLPLTAQKILVNQFKVNLSGQDQIDYLQPAVTIFWDILGREQTSMKIQTTISQRNLDIQY